MSDKTEEICCFTTNIAEELTCCQDSNFDEYGFPVNICPDFPCEKFLILERKNENEKY